MALSISPRGPANSRVIQARINAKEYAAIEELARGHGSTVSEVVRALVSDGLLRHASETKKEANSELPAV